MLRRLRDFPLSHNLRHFEVEEDGKDHKNGNRPIYSRCIIVSIIFTVVMVIFTLTLAIYELNRFSNVTVVIFDQKITNVGKMNDSLEEFLHVNKAFDTKFNIHLDTQLIADIKYPSFHSAHKIRNIQLLMLSNVERLKESTIELEEETLFKLSKFMELYKSGTDIEIVEHFFHDTEFYRRFRREGDTHFFSSIANNSHAIYNDSPSIYNTLPICVQQMDYMNGIGFRLWRDAQASYVSGILGCTIAIHWQWHGFVHQCHSPSKLTDIPIQNINDSDIFNLFEFLFYNNHYFSASNLSLEQHLKYDEMYPQITSLNKLYFNNLAIARYDLYNYNFFHHSSQFSTDVRLWIKDNLMQENVQMPAKLYHRLGFNVVNNENTDELVLLSMVDQDIDVKYGDIFSPVGHMNLWPIVQFYISLVQNLRFQFRYQCVKFMERHFKNRFVIGFHIDPRSRKYGYSIESWADYVVNSMLHLLEFRLIGNENLSKMKIFLATSFVFENNGMQTLIKSITEKLEKSDFRSINDLVIYRENQIRFSDVSIEEKKSKLRECTQMFGDSFIDAELLGFSDILIVRKSSTFTRLSRALIMKRHKVICIEQGFVSCKDFETGKVY